MDVLQNEAGNVFVKVLEDAREDYNKDSDIDIMILADIRPEEVSMQTKYMMFHMILIWIMRSKSIRVFKAYIPLTIGKRYILSL